jgi:hypothetical protein
MDLSALSRGRAIVGALLLIAALFIAGRFVLGAGSAQEAEPASSSATGELSAEPAPRLVVHVVGAVRRPGLYRLAHALGSPMRSIVPAGRPSVPT